MNENKKLMYIEEIKAVDKILGIRLINERIAQSDMFASVFFDDCGANNMKQQAEGALLLMQNLGLIDNDEYDKILNHIKKRNIYMNN